jgi:predicted hotdog family 3-hydroxylacyl-ACP dehydratase
VRRRAIALLPHKPPLLLVDHVRMDAPRPYAVSLVEPDCFLLDARGELHGAAFFELMAQGFAAIAAAQVSPAAGGPVPAEAVLGFLAGVKNFIAYGAAHAGEELRITLDSRMDVGNFSVVELCLHNAGGTLLASGQIKVFFAEAKDMALEPLP